MQCTWLILVLAVALAIVVLMSIFFGCCFRFVEKFEDGGAETEEKKGPTPLSAQEEEMFTNIRNGNLSDKEIQKFISSGALTEQMVERFLEHLDSMPSSSDKEEEPPKKPSKENKPVPPKKTIDEGFDIEGFSGSMYASATL